VKAEKGRSFILDPSDYLAKRGVPLCPEAGGPLPERGQRGQHPRDPQAGREDGCPVIQKFGSVKGVYQNLDKVQTEKLRALLNSAEAHEALKLSRALIQLNENLPIDDAIFQTGTQRTENLQEFFLTLDMVKTAEVRASPLPCPTLLFLISRISAERAFAVCGTVVFAAQHR
jgi:hypothetical protein